MKNGLLFVGIILGLMLIFGCTREVEYKAEKRYYFGITNKTNEITNLSNNSNIENKSANKETKLDVWVENTTVIAQYILTKDKTSVPESSCEIRDNNFFEYLDFDQTNKSYKGSIPINTKEVVVRCWHHRGEYQQQNTTLVIENLLYNEDYLYDADENKKYGITKDNKGTRIIFEQPIKEVCELKGWCKRLILWLDNSSYVLIANRENALLAKEYSPGIYNLGESFSVDAKRITFTEPSWERIGLTDEDNITFSLRTGELKKIGSKYVYLYKSTIGYTYGASWAYISVLSNTKPIQKTVWVNGTDLQSVILRDDLNEDYVAEFILKTNQTIELENHTILKVEGLQQCDGIPCAEVSSGRERNNQTIGLMYVPDNWKKYKVGQKITENYTLTGIEPLEQKVYLEKKKNKEKKGGDKTFTKCEYLMLGDKILLDNKYQLMPLEVGSWDVEDHTTILIKYPDSTTKKVNLVFKEKSSDKERGAYMIVNETIELGDKEVYIDVANPSYLFAGKWIQICLPKDYNYNIEDD